MTEGRTGAGESFAPALELRGFGVAFGDQTVLASVTLALPRVGSTTLVGPAGSGKSTLLRTLAGLNDTNPTLCTWGEALLDGSPLQMAQPEAPGDFRRGISMVLQRSRFFLASVRENLVSALPNRASLERGEQTRIIVDLLESNGLGDLRRRLDHDVLSLSTGQQRKLALMCALVPDPLVLLADEPMAELDDDDAAEVLALLRAQAQRRSVLFVTHHQGRARSAGGDLVLLASGRVQEQGPAASFFASPQTPCGQSYLRTGRCSETSPSAKAEHLTPSSPPPPELPAAARSRFEGPRGFFWVWPGRLGGLPRPGIVDDVQRDIDGLRRLGVTSLVTLEESETVARGLLDAASIRAVHFPIVDMAAPSVGAALEYCREIEVALGRGETIAVHCRAGLGRTGTVLAAQLIFSGETARGAIERVRRINPRCIQSQEQVDFLSALELAVTHAGPAPGRSASLETAERLPSLPSHVSQSEYRRTT